MKKRIYFLISLIITAALCMTGCIPGKIKAGGDSGIISQERAVTGFNGLVFSGVGDVNIYQSDYYRVTVKANSSIQDLIETEVSNDILYIRVRYNRWFENGFNPLELSIDIYMPELTSVRVNGSGNLFLVNGRSQDLKMNVNGACKIEADNYEVRNLDITLSGASDAKIWASSELSYRINGVCNIHYKGNPILNGRISGLGSIMPL